MDKHSTIANTDKNETEIYRMIFLAYKTVSYLLLSLSVTAGLAHVVTVTFF